MAFSTLVAVPVPGGSPVSFWPTMRVPARAAKSAAFWACATLREGVAAVDHHRHAQHDGGEGEGEQRDHLTVL